jgi:hypothetical protein
VEKLRAVPGPRWDVAEALLEGVVAVLFEEAET